MKEEKRMEQMEPKTSDHKFPYVLLTFSALFWGGNFVIGKAFAGVFPPFTLSLLRWTIALLFILPISWNELRQNVPLWKKEWKPLLAMALTGVAGFNSLLYVSVHYTTSINAALVNTSGPVIIALLSFLLLREKLSLRQGIGIAVSLAGVLLIISRGSFAVIASLSFNKGDLLMVLAVILWGIYSVLVKKHGNKFPFYGSFALTIIASLLILLPFAWREWKAGFPTVFSIPVIAGLLYIGLFASIFAFLGWNKAVASVGPGKASPFLNLIPVFASVFAVIFLQETLLWAQIVGGILVIAGVSVSAGLFTSIHQAKPRKASARQKSRTKPLSR